MQETDTGEEVPIGVEISCLLVDFSEEILLCLREYDPVTDGESIQHFWPELPETLPLSASLLEQALDWIAAESDTRVHYYSAAEEEEIPKKTYVEPGAKKVPVKPKKVTTATLADQLAALSESTTAITTQLAELRSNQARLEDVVARGQEVSRPLHQTDFPQPPNAGLGTLKDFAKVVGPPPKTKIVTPLKQQARQLFPEDEPKVNPDQEGYQPSQHVPPVDLSGGGATHALIQQSQATTALVAHLINQDSLVDLSSGSSSSLSTKGAAKRERLQTELASRSGNFMLQVAQSAFRRMRPTDSLPTELEDFRGGSLFTKFFEKQGGYQSQRDLALTQWMLAHIADCLLSEDVKGAQELVALSMVATDQACQDGGRWDVAYLLSLLEDPPPGVFAPRGKTTNPRLAAFSPICPQAWATTTLSYIKEMDLIATRRTEAAGPGRRVLKADEDPDKPAPKRRQPKFPKKPKADQENQVAPQVSHCMPDGGDLCSGTRSCQAPCSVAQPVDAKTSNGLSKGPKAFWNSLQSFSFVQWCSRLLGDVLASGTPFAAFVKKTLHASRSPSIAPAKALFPLPFPKFGLFEARSSRQSSRARRRLAFDQAFHILVAALNFLHADCAFPPMDLLVRTPMDLPLWQALWNFADVVESFR